MLCYECGYQDSTINGPHTCSEADLKRAAKRRTAGQARANRSVGGTWVWPAVFRAAIVMAAAIALMNLARLVVLCSEYSAISGLGDPPTAAQRAAALAAINVVREFAPFSTWTLVIYVLALGVWSFVARRVTRELGLSPSDLRHWSRTAAPIGLAAMLVVMFATRQTQPVTDLASARAAALRLEAGQIICTMLGIAFAGMVIAGVRALRHQLTEMAREKDEARLARERTAAARTSTSPAEQPAAP
jgi:hypothetical protein